MRFRYFIVAIAFITMLLTGCTQSQVKAQADELVANKWSSADKFGKELSLTFKDDTASLRVKTDDFDYEINGTVLLDEQTLKIFDDTLKQSYTFDYILYGDKIEIIYDDTSIELDKIIG